MCGLKEGKGGKRQSRRDGASERARRAPGSDPVTGRLEPSQDWEPPEGVGLGERSKLTWDGMNVRVPRGGWSLEP